MRTVYKSKIELFFKSISKVIKGHEGNIKLLFAAFLSRGHVLLEGLPGMGKTTLSLAFAKLLGLEFKRIQGTSDMLPADIIGAFIPQGENGEMVFLKGPVFCDVLLVDEINRMNPRTQSALLEAMEERHVTVEGHTYPLSPLFFVIATQNPVESYGTFPLPASQLDRFMLRIQINRVPEEIERQLLREGDIRKKIDSLSPVFNKEELFKMIDEAKKVKVSRDIEDYILALGRAVRSHPVFSSELSTRALLHLVEIAKSIAYIEGRDYVVPDDVKASFKPLVIHRIGLQMILQDREKLLDEIKSSVEPPL